MENTSHFKVILEKGAILPEKAHESDAGFDIFTREDAFIKPGSSWSFNTGVHILIPEGYVGFLKSKSGLNVKQGIQSEGVIDAGYTGSIVVKLYNHSDTTWSFRKGQKITQLVILPLPKVELDVVDDFKESTERGDNGFGSTGK